MPVFTITGHPSFFFKALSISPLTFTSIFLCPDFDLHLCFSCSAVLELLRFWLISPNGLVNS